MLSSSAEGYFFKRPFCWLFFRRRPVQCFKINFWTKKFSTTKMHLCLHACLKQQKRSQSIIGFFNTCLVSCKKWTKNQYFQRNGFRSISFSFEANTCIPLSNLFCSSNVRNWPISLEEQNPTITLNLCWAALIIALQSFMQHVPVEN